MITGILDFDTNPKTLGFGDANDILALTPSRYADQNVHVPDEGANVQLWAEWDGANWQVYCSDPSWEGYVMYTIVQK
tara:strand:+ start:346 stop:576 length:231 start_codon:yes stop_codon:yes gene_type:complete